MLAMLLFATALGLGYSGIKDIISASKARWQLRQADAACAYCGNSVYRRKRGNVLVYYILRQKLDSQALKADAWHHRSDAFSSIAGFVGILGAMLGVYVLEGIATVLIALLIVKVSYDIVKVAIRQLYRPRCARRTCEQDL